MRHSIRTAAAAATAGLSLVMGLATPASAAVSSGGGQEGHTTTVCQEYVTGQDMFEARAALGQEYDGQYVAARFWIYDSRGWVTATSWEMSNDPGWSYDGVAFHHTFSGVQPVSGGAVWLYVQYAWYTSAGWKVGGELLQDYTSITGSHMRYCLV